MKAIFFFLTAGLFPLYGVRGDVVLPRTTAAHAARMREIWKANRWKLKDERLFKEYVEPQTTLGERRVDWLPVLKPLAEKMAEGARTPFEAATLINRKISGVVGVVYSTKRDLPNQDPLHSMRIGLASCSGLSILLVDACRSVGIPARIVGCFWRKKPGNHSWVEVWSEGDWHTIGAFEDVPPDKVWFKEDAADADGEDPRYMIYAARATPAPDKLRFRGWNVPADNVTARYARKAAASNGVVRVHIAAERKGERVELPFTVNGKAYRTPGARRDRNDYTDLLLPAGTNFTVEIGGRRFSHEAREGAIYIERLE